MENINLDKIIKADELDTNMILSVPEEIGLQIQKIIQGQISKSEKESLHIEILENPSDSMELDESRKLIFKINDILLPITLLDLPCIIEAKKTIDYKNFYKSGDIAQMMFVHDKEHKLDKEDDIAKFDPFAANDSTFNKIVWKKDYDHRYKLKNGLGKGTRDIRSKRFKRKIRYNGEEILEVAKKLKMIIDNGAASFENQMRMEQSQNDEDILKLTIGENQSERQSASDYNVQHVGNVNVSNQIIASATFNNFAVPHSRNSTNKKKNRGKVEKIPLNGNMNININLSHPIEFNENQKLFTSSQFSSQNIQNMPVTIALESIKIPTADDNEEDFDNIQSIDPKELELIEEYSNLKEEYLKVKTEMETNSSKELSKLKKKIKKRLKDIKTNFKKDN
jgi:hypothetical protein